MPIIFYLPTGAVLRFEGLDKVEGASREDLRALCDPGVKFVEFERGQVTGYVRLDGPRAIEVKAKIAPGGSTKIRDIGVGVAVLDGDDELAYWARLAETAAKSRKRPGRRRHRGQGGNKRARN